MNNKELLEIVKTKEPEFLTQAPKMVNRHNSYVCPLCNNGAGGKSGDGIAFKNKNGNIYYTCFNCGVSGSVFDWWCYDKDLKEPKQEIEQEKYFTALKGIAEYYNVDYNPPTTTKTTKITEHKPIKAITTATEQTAPEQEQEPEQATVEPDEIEKQEYKDYLKSRNIDYNRIKGSGITAGTIKGNKYIGVKNISGGLALRAIKDTDYNKKYRKINNGKTDITLFNQEQTTTDIIFITEGFFDSLSLYQIRINSICLNSVSNINKLYDYLQANKQDYKYKVLLLVLDSDDAGIKASQEIKNYLYDLGLDIRIANIFKANNYNDINEFATKDYTSFINTIAELKKAVLTDIKDNNPDTFLYWWNYNKQYENSIKEIKHKTGLADLDDILGGGLPVGLTTLGALSGVGKTTLLTQIAETIAISGVNVLFFSLEQPAGELFNKGLIRNLYYNHRIGCDKYDLDLNVNDYYKKIKYFYNIVSGDFNTTTYHIQEKIHQIKKYSKAPLVVIVDYLQALKPCNMKTGEIEKRLSDKQATDLNIENLKMISKKFLIPIVAVSSLNRQNYYSKVEFDSFKESGNIEYTSDIVLAMDFATVRHFTEKSNTETNKAKVFEIVDTQYKNDIKEISIITLKNRFNKPRQIADLTFLAKYGVFTDNDTFYNPDTEEPDLTEQTEPEQEPEQNKLFDIN